MIRLIIAITVLFFITQSSASHRREMSMGEYINYAELIVIGETIEIDDQPYIKVRKVLKGDKNFNKTNIALFNNKGSIRAMGRIPAPTHNKNVAIFLNKDWQKKYTSLMIMKTYKGKKNIKSLLKMYKTLTIEDETKRLNAIKKEMLKGKEHFIKQFYEEVKQMSNPDNFDILIDVYNKTDTENKIKIIDVFENINDISAVPLLIKALSSKSKEIRENAAHALYFYFPGATGLLKAFSDKKNITGVKYYANMYLKNYYTNIVTNSKQKHHPWYIAKQLLAKGQEKQAKKIYYDLIADTKQETSDRVYSSNLLLKIANQQDKDYILKQMLPVLTRQIKKGLFTEVEQAVTLLKKLNYKKCLPAFLEVFKFEGFSYDDSVFLTVLAIEELGVDARDKAIEVILQKFKDREATKIYTQNDELYAVALAWLNTKPNFDEYESLFTKHFIKKLDLIKNKSQSKDQVAFFSNLLRNLPVAKSLIERKLEKWSLFRLAEIKDDKHIKVLIERVEKSNEYSYDYETEKTLKAIGGINVETEVIRLLDNPQKHIRAKATRILSELMKERSLPYLQKILNDDNYGDRNEAYTYLYHYGTPKELPQLKAFCNYWQKDKSNFYGSCHAMIGIRDRYNYDIKGPIKHNSHF